MGIIGGLLFLLTVAVGAGHAFGLIKVTVRSYGVQGLDFFWIGSLAVGAFLLLNAVSGFWWTFRDLAPVTATGPVVSPTEPVSEEDAEDLELKPPFVQPSGFTPFPYNDVDPDFIAAARHFYQTQLGGTLAFENATRRVFRSGAGRPSWFFLVDLGTKSSDALRWIYVPHAGEAGAGPSSRGPISQ